MAGTKARHIAARVWQTAGFFAVLLLASAVVVAFVISQVTDRSVELAFGAEGGPIGTASSTKAAQKEAADSPGSLVQDDKGVVWSVQSADIDVFHESYLSPDGTQVTVQSANGDKVVAPGTEGTYDFTTRNSVESEIDYQLKAQVLVSPQIVNLPLEGRMMSPDGWLVGGDDTWVPLREMGLLEDTVSLGSHESRSYRLQWRWRFERSDGDGVTANDAQDLALEGTSSESMQDLDVQIKLDAIGSYDRIPGAESSSSSKGGSKSKTGSKGDSKPGSKASAPAFGAASGSGSASDSGPFGFLPRTDDLVSVFPIVAVALAALLVMLAIGRRRRRAIQRDSAAVLVGSSGGERGAGGGDAPADAADGAAEEGDARE